MSKAAVHQALVALLKGGRKLRPLTAVDQIVRQSGLTRLAVHDGLAELVNEGAIEGVARDGRPVKMVGWTVAPEEEIDAFALRWADLAVPKLAAPKAARDLGDADLVALTHCLAGLDGTALPGEDRYVLSANAVMGASKALDAFPGLIKVAGRQRPLFVVTAGPTDPAAVLLVENPSAFISLARSRFVERYLTICVFGYGLTIENLHERLVDGSIIPCAAVGQPVINLSETLSLRPCFHWGDLDWEGLRIFEGLRTAIPHLKLPAIYHAMAERLTDPRRSHPYAALFGKNGQREPFGNDPIVAHFAKLCSSRAVDQEAMCPVGDLSLLVTPA